MKLFLILFIINQLFLPNQIYGMDFRERMKATINDLSQSGNRIIIERGIEDGVEIGDYGRIYLGQHLIGSAVAIDLEKDLSEWVFHRLYRYHALKTNDQIIIISLYGKKRPIVSNLESYKTSSMLEKRRKEKHQKEIEAVAKIRGRRTEKMEKIIDDYDDYQTISLPPISMEIFASPVEFRSGNRSSQYHIGTNIKTSNSDPHQFSLNYLYQYQSFKSVIPNNNYSHSKNHLEARYFKSNFWGKIQQVALLSFDRESEKNIYPIKSQIRVAPFGLKYAFITNQKIIKDFSLIYIPLKEYYTFESITQNNLNNPKVEQISTIRHQLELNLELNITKKIFVNENFIYRPSHNLFTGPYNHDDSDILNTLNISYEVYPRFLLGVQNKFSRDIRRRDSIGYPATQTENSIQVYYQFDKR